MWVPGGLRQFFWQELSRRKLLGQFLGAGGSGTLAPLSWTKSLLHGAAPTEPPCSKKFLQQKWDSLTHTAENPP
jgi:hypothetical protein